jgi:hypothetical protein
MSMDPIPEIFKPLAACTRSDDVRFNIIPKGYVMLPAEKEWLCKEADLNAVVPIWPGQERRKKGLIRRYGLYKKWFEKNWPIYINPNRGFTGSGRPEAIDEQGWRVIAEHLAKCKKEVNEASITELTCLMSNEAIMTGLRRQRPLGDDFRELDGRTVKHHKKEKGITTGSPGLTTDARVKACSCPRMSFMWYLICYVLSRILPGSHKWNSDGTTYVFESKGKGEKVCSLADDSQLKDLLDEIDEEDGIFPKSSAKGKKSSSQDNDLAFAIKVMHLSNAAGDSGPACVLLANKRMPKDKFYVKHVKGLYWGNGVSRTGILYVCQTRAGTKEMWLDWHRRVCLPTIRDSNEYYDNKKVHR